MTVYKEPLTLKKKNSSKLLPSTLWRTSGKQKTGEA